MFPLRVSTSLEGPGVAVKKIGSEGTLASEALSASVLSALLAATLI
jgi:hypothetical protein